MNDQALWRIIEEEYWGKNRQSVTAQMVFRVAARVQNSYEGKLAELESQHRYDILALKQELLRVIDIAIARGIYLRRNDEDLRKRSKELAERLPKGPTA